MNKSKHMLIPCLQVQVLHDFDCSMLKLCSIAADLPNTCSLDRIKALVMLSCTILYNYKFHVDL